MFHMALKWSVLTLALLAAGSAARADRLLDSFDIPLIDGMTLDPERMLWFDSPEGRVLEVVATGPVPAARVRNYYRASLPMLGWKQQPIDSKEIIDTETYHREGERLELQINRLADSTHLRLTLAPSERRGD